MWANGKLFVTAIIFAIVNLYIFVYLIHFVALSKQKKFCFNLKQKQKSTFVYCVSSFALNENRFSLKIYQMRLREISILFRIGIELQIVYGRGNVMCTFA
jgi:hypothetical protein